MVFIDTTTVGIFLTAVLVLAVLGSALGLAAVTQFVVSNRRTRVARHESVVSYYRGLALSH